MCGLCAGIVFFLFFPVFVLFTRTSASVRVSVPARLPVGLSACVLVLASHHAVMPCVPCVPCAHVCVSRARLCRVAVVPTCRPVLSAIAAALA